MFNIIIHMSFALCSKQLKLLQYMCMPGEAEGDWTESITKGVIENESVGFLRWNKRS